MSLVEYRCPDCKRLLFKSDCPGGRVQVPCPRCGTVKMVRVIPPIRLVTARA